MFGSIFEFFLRGTTLWFLCVCGGHVTSEYLVVMHSVLEVYSLLGAVNSTWKKVSVYDKIVPTPSLLVLMLLKMKKTFSCVSLILLIFLLTFHISIL